MLLLSLSPPALAPAPLRGWQLALVPLLTGLPPEEVLRAGLPLATHTAQGQGLGQGQGRGINLVRGDVDCCCGG